MWIRFICAWWAGDSAQLVWAELGSPGPSWAWGATAGCRHLGTVPWIGNREGPRFHSVHPCSFMQSQRGQPDVSWGDEAAAAECPHTGDRAAGEPRAHGAPRCVGWHSASPEGAGRALGCVWAGDTPCRAVGLAQPLFPSVSSADGESGSACP